jgi:hypothetical protein
MESVLTVIECIIFLALGVACIFVGIKIIMSLEKIDAFHKKVEEEYRPQIASWNDQVDEALETIDSMDDLIDKTHKIFTKINEIFDSKKTKRRYKKARK